MRKAGIGARSLPSSRRQFLKHTNHLTSDGGASDDANDDGASAASPNDADANAGANARGAPSEPVRV
jgi:hypothetical protein